MGINRRNAEYIMRLNPRSRFPLVDDKVLTKGLAQEHGIATPPLYHIVRHHGEVASFPGIVEKREEFAVKPARGSGGGGIVLVFGHNGDGFVKQNGDIISGQEMAYHLHGILSGIYSLEALEDKVIVEGLIHPDPLFAKITYHGVPDVRIIVYRGVPAMAMVRLPTRASDGKANLHRGAIGAGLDIGTGVLTTAVHGKNIVSRHPDTGNEIPGMSIPRWDEMLLIAAKGYDMTGMGYIGVDLVIDEKRGPLLLELNARPGIQIQMANRAGLWSRMERIDRAPQPVFNSPDSRAEWARSAFTDGGTA
jgi:alpha-L-glutamate ligase-like protein